MNIPPVLRKIVGYFVAWTFIHLVFLSLGWNGKIHDEFWPFTPHDLNNTYNIPEFLVYVFGPIVAFYVLYQLFAAEVDEKNENILQDKNQVSELSGNLPYKRPTLFSESELRTIKFIIYAIIILSILSAVLKAIGRN